LKYGAFDSSIKRQWGEGGSIQLKRHDSIKQLVLEQERNDTGEEEDEKKS
jgi:hypothetical protein